MELYAQPATLQRGNTGPGFSGRAPPHVHVCTRDEPGVLGQKKSPEARRRRARRAPVRSGLLRTPKGRCEPSVLTGDAPRPPLATHARRPPVVQSNRSRRRRRAALRRVVWVTPVMPSIASWRLAAAALLRSLGVPTQLVIYPGQFHGLTVPSYLEDRSARMIAWFTEHLGS